MSLEIEEQTEHHRGRWLFGIVIFALVTAIGWYAYRWYTTGDLPPLPFLTASAGASVDESDVNQEQISVHHVSAASPRYLSIQSLGIEKARVRPVGLDTNNILIFPDNINDVGWYEKSSLPGDGGVIIADGHNMGTTRSGVFAKLGTVAIDDTILIERGDGKKFTYKVQELIDMNIEEFVTNGMKMMAEPFKESKETLNITTNNGKWVPRLGTFDSRILLRAIIAE